MYISLTKSQRRNFMFTQTKSKDLLLKLNRQFVDNRGNFSPVISTDDIEEAGGIWKNLHIEQVNVVHNKADIIRGMHLQKPPFAQAKVISVIDGAIRDVVIDLRIESETFGISYYFDLFSHTCDQLWVPFGFAHGYEVLLEGTIVQYSILGGKYHPESELCITPLDVSFWVFQDVNSKYCIADRDKNGLQLNDAIDQITSGKLIL
jgi:dTDP-4-dehydrorhamnose 3,5-epimerase